MILFGIECVDSYAASLEEGDKIKDIFFLRVAWVALVNPNFIVFSIFGFVYYGMSIVRIDYVIPGYDVAKKHANITTKDYVKEFPQEILTIPEQVHDMDFEDQEPNIEDDNYQSPEWFAAQSTNTTPWA
jgi:hypothetical protein